MINFVTLALLVLTLVLSIGGGLYEILVIYPNWKHSTNADELKERLQSSGQNFAGTRFWPLTSPLQALLSIVNLVFAWRFTGSTHRLLANSRSVRVPESKTGCGKKSCRIRSEPPSRGAIYPWNGGYNKKSVE